MDKGLATPRLTNHMVFSGNPGTGKTTIARLVSKIYHNLGYLSKGHFIETDRAGLVGGYLGQTALKAKKIVASAIGGVLFIDEAYTLQKDDYGQEAIDTILKLMEDHRDDLIIIVAGYTENIKEFINSNPGLKSRFTRYVDFPDYNPEELVQVIDYFAKQSQMVFTADALEHLKSEFLTLYENRDDKFGNARLARNMYEQSIRQQANRLVKESDITEEVLITITLKDVSNS